MKTKYWIAIFAVLLLLCTLGSWMLLRPQPAAQYAEIWSDGTLARTVSLGEAQQFEIKTATGSNTVTVDGGKIAVTAASCPDHYCMQRGFCDSGADIVCLPNRLVIKFSNDAGLDAVVG